MFAFLTSNELDPMNLLTMLVQLEPGHILFRAMLTFKLLFAKMSFEMNPNAGLFQKKFLAQ